VAFGEHDRERQPNGGRLALDDLLDVADDRFGGGAELVRWQRIAEFLVHALGRQRISFCSCTPHSWTPLVCSQVPAGDRVS
jgi:hypothetical protein